MSAPLSPRVLVSAFLRSLMIQGSWNYHTMLGSGFAFAMLPGLRKLHKGEAGALEKAIERHLEHFNAHPYLTGVALGASLRLEADGEDSDTVRRFKMAVRGPLGSLGDALVWATWLPAVSVLALGLYWLGLPGWMAAVLFLAVYNVGHLGLRLWGFVVGLREGREVGRRLARADLAGWMRRLKSVAVVLLGVLVGALLGGQGGVGAQGATWVALAAAAFLAGLLAGHHAWRPAAATVVVAIVLLSAWGLMR